MPLVDVQPAQFRCSYNGFTFDGASTETLSIESHPEYDEARRTIIWMRYTIRLRTTIFSAANTTTDLEMGVIRKQLQSPGGALVYEQRGFGGFSINAGRGAKDSSWGPRPQVLSWKPIGDANAAEVEWACEVCIPECDAAKFEDHAAAFNWKVTYERDPDGFTTRKVSGYVQIPQTRDAQGNRQFRHSADEYREKITPVTPFNFRPLAATFTLSMDKCRLDFQCADQEMGRDIPPPGIIRVDADMSSANDRDFAMLRFIYTISCTYTIAQGFPTDIAFAYFERLVALRKLAIKAAANAAATTDISIRQGEPRIYNQAKQAKFSLTFAVICKDARILTGGFFEPVPDSDYQLWAAKMKDVIFNPRGQAGLKFDPKEDIIVDLCQADIGGNRMGNDKLGKLKQNPAPRPAGGKIRDKNEPSFILWDQAFRFESESSPYVHKPLIEPPKTSSSPGLSSAGESVLRTPNLIGRTPGIFAAPGESSIDPSTASVCGERTAPTYYLIYTGRAIRAGKPISCPTVLGLGPLKVIPANRPGDGFTCHRVPGLLGTIYVAVWRLRFLVPAKVGTDGAADNPTFSSGVEKPEWHGRPGGGNVDALLNHWDFQMEQWAKEFNHDLKHGPASGGLRPF